MAASFQVELAMAEAPAEAQSRAVSARPRKPVDPLSATRIGASSFDIGVGAGVRQLTRNSQTAPRPTVTSRGQSC